jgi:hypothetical protein
LPDADAVAVATHLAECEACRVLADAVPESELAQRLRVAHQAGVNGDLAMSPMPHDATGPTVPAELIDHRYRVIGFIGAGGMGAVYKAEHKLMGRVVALKVIRRGLLSSVGAAERFLREVRAAAQLSHANIVQAFDADEASGLRFLVMEFVEGETLDRVVARTGPLQQVAACDYIRQAALGLQHAHERGLTHRDVKPHNLILTPAGVVKILDFGLARLFASGNAEEPQGPPAGVGGTSPGTVLGTAGYVSPEQSTAPQTADCRADVYGLGATMTFLLTGSPPNSAGQPPEGLPEPLASVLAQMLAPNPAERFHTPGEVADALMPLVGGLTTRRSWARWAWAGLLAGLLSLPVVVVTVVMVQPPASGTDAGGDAQPAPSPIDTGRGRDIGSLHKLDNPPGGIGEGRLLEGHAHPVVGVAFAADGSRLFSADATGELRSWGLNGTPSRVFHVEPEEWTDATAFFAPPVGAKGQNKAVLGGRDGVLRVWDLNEGRLLRRLKPDRGARIGGDELPSVSSVAFFSDGERVAVPGDDGGIVVWNLERRVETGKHWVDAMRAPAVAVHPDGQRAAYSTRGGEIRVCDLNANRELFRCNVRETHANRLVFSPSGSLLAGGLANGEVAVWDVEKQTEKYRFAGWHRFPAIGVAFASDDRLVSASGADQAVALWDLNTGTRLSRWQSPRGPLVSIAVVAGERFACGSKDGAVWLRSLLP